VQVFDKSVLVQCRGTNLQRSKKFVMVQTFYYVQLQESGFIISYKSVLVVGAKAKTVTNKLPLLSVLGGRSNF
jgi:hypothetical protein